MRTNLEYFKNFDKEQILNHRKNKFLLIGRSKGFINQDKNINNLMVNIKLKDKIIEKFSYINKTYLSVVTILGVILTLIILLN